MAAQWAQDVLVHNPPAQIIRIKTSKEALAAWLPICNKIVYAAGLERNQMPVITGQPLAPDEAMGIIGPHLFGLGIAFPELVDDGNGRCSYSIGIVDFLLFVQRVLPTWMIKKDMQELAKFKEFEEYFNCYLL
jgi:hypothetical protein